MDSYRRRLLWNGDSNSRKYHLVNWDTVCTPKNQGGLGILNLRCMNISLLTKWLWKLENGDGLWQTIVKKYNKRKPLCFFKKKQGIPSSGDIIDIKDFFCNNRRRMIGNGLNTSFWCDKWCGDSLLSKNFKKLFELSLNKEISVSSVLILRGISLTSEEGFLEREKIIWKH